MVKQQQHTCLHNFNFMRSQLDLPHWIHAVKGKHIFMIQSDLAQKNWEQEFPKPLSHYKKAKGSLFSFFYFSMKHSSILSKLHTKRRHHWLVHGTKSVSEDNLLGRDNELHLNANTVQPNSLWKYNHILKKLSVIGAQPTANCQFDTFSM